MPLPAGSPIVDLDFTPRAHASEPGQFTFNATTWGIDADSGTYEDCAVVFMAPTTGSIEIDLAAQAHNSTTAGTQIAPVVREGSVIGSGSVVLAASIENMIQVAGTNSLRLGVSVPLDGLDPGATYNCRLEHEVSSASTGTIMRRTLAVKSAV